MPKRSYPFLGDDSFSPQLKKHVDEKRVNNGVLCQDKMKAVYDRTLSLLYNGARNYMNNNTNEAMDASPSTQKVSKNNLHQMVLTTHGTLTKPLHITKGMSSQLQSTTVCDTCKNITSLKHLTCAYCECKLCYNCIRTCHFCKGDFCRKCSLTIYLQEEHVVCLSCC
ncbi:hypothetical protein SK128_000574 [Halocaridina rubra]|uniref:Apoptosis regulatory protein Siva n=1 Tax=Halocaridina rubra TaxID=373956 RepID=A0AAN8WZF8_HALRR